MARQNAAYDYDFDRFDSVERAHPKAAQPPELRVVKARESRDNTFLVQLAVLFGCTLILFAAVIYNRMVLTEMTTKMEAIQGEYEMLKDDYQRMQVELEGKLSLRAVEEIASSQLGMAKAESYQIEYVDLGSDSRVLYAKEPTPTAATYIQAIIEQVKEYISR